MCIVTPTTCYIPNMECLDMVNRLRKTTKRNKCIWIDFLSKQPFLTCSCGIGIWIFQIRLLSKGRDFSFLFFAGFPWVALRVKEEKEKETLPIMPIPQPSWKQKFRTSKQGFLFLVLHVTWCGIGKASQLVR